MRGFLYIFPVYFFYYIQNIMKKPLIFVLFGSTGDLALKKIFPALETLYTEGAYTSKSHIVAVGRRDFDAAQFKQFLAQSAPHLSSDFTHHIQYEKVDIEKNEGYGTLAKTLVGLAKHTPGSEIMIYLSLAPEFHLPVLKMLKKTRILKRGNVKLLIEKPFGTNEKTACALNTFLDSFISEKQIYRVDHYLGKDTIRTVMDLHERTPSFGKLLTEDTVTSIRVRIFETHGIHGRGASYDGVGAFRDVGQNHMLEMLAVIAADLPYKRSKKYRATIWQDIRTEVFEHLSSFAKTCQLSRRGQYEGYAEEKGVKPGSETETGFELLAHFKTGKLKGVPLIIESGKKMHASEAFITVKFNDEPELPKSMHFEIQPRQQMVIEYKDGYRDTFVIPKVRDAYANVIHAALAGSGREFVGPHEIKALWNYADHVIACWDQVPLEIYGSKKSFFDSFSAF